MNNKTFLFVDGSNLYAGQYGIFGPDRYLDFTLFVRYIEKSLSINFDAIYFYASYSPKSQKPSRKEILFLKNEGLFYRRVKQTKNTHFFKGYRSPTSGKEKEVDVKLAVDIVDFGHRQKYHNIYLLSGDADFLQALFAVKSLQKQIAVICLENKILYRAAFYFQTYVFTFREQRKMPFLKFQKSKVILIGDKKREMVKKIK